MCCISERNLNFPSNERFYITIKTNIILKINVCINRKL